LDDTEWIETQESVEIFIKEASQVLIEPDYDLVVQRERKEEDPLDLYTTKNTLLDLEYDEDDVKAEILTLLPCHYCKTAVDTKRPTSPPFRFFVKEIKGKDVYIKFKIRGIKKKQMFCMSFHYPRWSIENRPYCGQSARRPE